MAVLSFQNLNSKTPKTPLNPTNQELRAPELRACFRLRASRLPVDEGSRGFRV